MARRRDYGGRLTPNERGIYEWRRTHPVTGHRDKRSTGVRTLGDARRIAKEWEEEFDRLEVGLGHLNGWKRELLPLVEPWAKTLEGSERWQRQLKDDLVRALGALRLVRAADLDALGVLEERLLALEGKVASRTALRRQYQTPLRRFSAWLAGNKRYLDRDPLALWEPIRGRRGRAPRKGRAFEPAECARALLALDRIDDAREAADRTGKVRPRTRPTYLALLITAPRATAFTSRDVEHLLEDRIDLGPGNAIKRTGRGALDPATAEELRAYVGEREAGGPLFLSPWGARWTKDRLIDRWREAFALGLVDEFWPADAPRELALARDVAYALLHGSARNRGGNPGLVTDTSRLRRAKRVAQVAELVERLRDSVLPRLEGVTLHGFRSTHKSWATAHVPGPAIDVQLGWAQDVDPGQAAVMKLAAGSRTGRKHYLDAGLSMFDPGASAAAVREVLDAAIAAVEEGGSMLALERAGGVRRARA